MPRPSDSADEFDYVIVGAGAAGCLLAARLSEDPGTTVCLLEAGPADRHPFLHIPAGFIKLLFNPAYTWQIKTEPGEAVGARRITVVQGRVLGGSSSLNGMIYNRGQPIDFDYWAQRGNPGWSYADVLPYFKRTERKLGATDQRFHGSRGDLPVSDTDWTHPLTEAFIAGAAGLGIPNNYDYNGADQLGAGYYQRTIAGGLRRSAASAFLKPAMRSGRVDVRTSCHAHSLVLDGRRCTAVRYSAGGREPVRVARARREVIVSAGALNTPKLLQLSGIGPADVLGGIGVPVVRDLPVGRNFRDHYIVRVVARARNVITINQLARFPRLAGQAARWAAGRPSVLAIPPSVAFLFWKSDAALDAADLQGMFTPASYKEGFIGLLDSFPGMTLGIRQHQPESVGFVWARSSDPFEHPLVQPNYLSAEKDRQVLVGGIKLARRLLRSAELAPFYEREELPGDAVRTDDELVDFARRKGSSSYHVTGTARMGPASDNTSVVDPELRVHGMDGLRVVDASVMPGIVSANTYAATLMIAEKAADMIRGRPALP